MRYDEYNNIRRYLKYVEGVIMIEEGRLKALNEAKDRGISTEGCFSEESTRVTLNCYGVFQAGLSKILEEAKLESVFQ